ncbi:MAG: hypothetical protein ABSB52_07525 [Acidimicrobiales bacterium]|jgi:hypothetical protein
MVLDTALKGALRPFHLSFWNTPRHPNHKVRQQEPAQHLDGTVVGDIAY